MKFDFIEFLPSIRIFFFNFERSIFSANMHFSEISGHTLAIIREVNSIGCTLTLGIGKIWSLILLITLMKITVML